MHFGRFRNVPKSSLREVKKVCIVSYVTCLACQSFQRKTAVGGTVADSDSGSGAIRELLAKREQLSGSFTC